MLLLGKTQKKHPGDLPPTVPELSTYMPNFIEIKETFCEQTNIHM